MKWNYILFGVAALSVGQVFVDAQGSEAASRGFSSDPDHICQTKMLCLHKGSVCDRSIEECGTCLYWKPESDPDEFFRCGTANNDQFCPTRYIDLGGIRCDGTNYIPDTDATPGPAIIPTPPELLTTSTAPPTPAPALPAPAPAPAPPAPAPAPPVPAPTPPSPLPVAPEAAPVAVTRTETAPEETATQVLVPAPASTPEAVVTIPPPPPTVETPPVTEKTLIAPVPVVEVPTTSTIALPSSSGEPLFPSAAPAIDGASSVGQEVAVTTSNNIEDGNTGSSAEFGSLYLILGIIPMVAMVAMGAKKLKKMRKRNHELKSLYSNDAGLEYNDNTVDRSTELSSSHETQSFYLRSSSSMEMVQPSTPERWGNSEVSDGSYGVNSEVLSVVRSTENEFDV